MTKNDAIIECCFWTSGSVTATVNLNKRCFVPGESIMINAEIVNSSRTPVTGTRASLKQVCQSACLLSASPII